MRSYPAGFRLWAGGLRPLAAVIPASIGAGILIILWTPFLFWWALPNDDGMTAAGFTVVGFLYLPLVAWGPLLGAVTYDYFRRHRTALAK